MDAWYGVPLSVDEMADVGLLLDVELHEQVEIAGGRINLGGELGVRQLVGDFIRFAELAFDLNEEGDHSRLRAASAAGGNPANTAGGGKGCRIRPPPGSP